MGTIKKSILKETVNQVITKKVLRHIAAKQLDKFLYRNALEMDGKQLKQEKLDKYTFMVSILDQVIANLDKGYIKPSVMKKLAQVFINDSYSLDRHKKLNPIKEAYREKYGDYPPNFLLLSPGKGCNLHCTGCYASSKSAKAEKLDFETSRKIVREAHDLFGDRFITISGGEPFLYKSEGKTIFDLFEEFDDMLFLVYTNGTLITKEVAQKCNNAKIYNLFFC